MRPQSDLLISLRTLLRVVAAGGRLSGNSITALFKGLFVNLYLPSTLRWEHDGLQISLVQSGSYPLGAQIQTEVKVSQPVAFGLYLRIPEWAYSGFDAR